MELPQNIVLLLEKYFSGTLAEDEKKLLDEWYHSFNDNETELENEKEESEQQLSERIKSRIMDSVRKESKATGNYKRKWFIPAAAASVIIILSVGFYFVITGRHEGRATAKASPVQANINSRIVPGGNKATLTLANGSVITLDSANNGLLTQQGNIKIRKLANGLVAYDFNGNNNVFQNDVYYNTISTPRGGEYQVTLSDGTKVWLNAASSIRFPVVFTGKERKVEITGEAYFEVAKNKEMPFKVEANSSEVEVYGTHFNVNAYDDEAAIKTTLLEGKVKVSVPGEAPEFLLPGQQADVNKEGKIKVLKDVDTNMAVAWMHGYFQFKSADLQSILRQISRWYDVDVVYEGNVNLHFTGQLRKNLDVSKVFETLSLTNEVHFTIKDKKIIVTP
jgi:ferric-dicitrate binding protein FerR (iron transport regulator)